MPESRNVTRRNLLATAACAAGALTFSNVGKARADEMWTGDLAKHVRYLYIDSTELELGAEQNVVIALADINAVASAELVLREVETEEELYVGLTRSSGSALLFTVFPEDEATYYVDQLSYVAEDRSEQTLCFADVDPSYRSFVAAPAISSLSAEEGELSENEVELQVYASQDGETLDESASIEEGMAGATMASRARSGSARSLGAGDDGVVSIALDPGHSEGSDSGAIGVNGAQEAVCNWKIARACQSELWRYSHVRVVMTRDQREYKTIEQRVIKAVEEGCDAIVSLHLNSINGNAYGAEVYVPSGVEYNYETHEVGMTLGKEIISELEGLGLYNRGVRTRQVGSGSDMHDYDYADGSRGDYYGIIRYARKANMTGLIVEHAVIDNASDYKNFLNSDAKLAALGKADAKGIADAYGLKIASESEFGAVYNYDYYVSNHKDLAGMGRDEAFSHFLQYGMDEGRQAIASFSPSFYRNNNKDLRKLFGSSMRAYYYHYLDSGKAEGRPGTGSAAAVVTLWRLYNPYTGQHLYTKGDVERNRLTYYGWQYEGVAWEAPAKGASSDVVWRLYNPYNGDHHYTMKKDEYDHLGKIGWKKEGQAWYSASKSEKPLYRLFNRYETVGTHHYTLSADERDKMIKDGWKYESVAWYGI